MAVPPDRILGASTTMRYYYHNVVLMTTEALKNRFEAFDQPVVTSSSTSTSRWNLASIEGSRTDAMKDEW
jgi:hypothetical protein